MKILFRIIQANLIWALVYMAVVLFTSFLYWESPVSVMDYFYGQFVHQSGMMMRLAGFLYVILAMMVYGLLESDMRGDC